jgi:hypothetical protein
VYWSSMGRLARISVAEPEAMAAQQKLEF